MRMLFIGLVAFTALSAFAVEINCTGLETNSTYSFKGLRTRVPFSYDVAPVGQMVRIYLNGERVGRTVIFSKVTLLDKTYVLMSSDFEVAEISKMRWVNGGFTFNQDGTMIAADIEYKIGRLWNSVDVKDQLDCQQVD